MPLRPPTTQYVGEEQCILCARLISPRMIEPLAYLRILVCHFAGPWQLSDATKCVNDVISQPGTLPDNERCAPPGCTLYTWAINIYSPSGVSPWHCYILVRYSKPEQLDGYTKAVELHLLHQA